MKILHIYFILVDYSMTTIKELIKCIVEAHILYCNKKNLIKSFLISCTLFIPLNFILLINQHMTGKAAVSIVEYLKFNNLLDITCPQAIDSHVGNYFEKKTT